MAKSGGHSGGRGSPRGSQAHSRGGGPKGKTKLGTRVVPRLAGKRGTKPQGRKQLSPIQKFNLVQAPPRTVVQVRPGAAKIGQPGGGD